MLHVDSLLWLANSRGDRYIPHGWHHRCNDDLSQIERTTRLLKLQKRLSMGYILFGDGINSLPLVYLRRYRNYPPLSGNTTVSLRPRAPLWCRKWINSHVYVNKRGVTKSSACPVFWCPLTTESKDVIWFKISVAQSYKVVSEEPQTYAKIWHVTNSCCW